jgi:hypothetical protein
MRTIAPTNADPSVSVAQASLAALSMAAAAIHFAVMGQHFAEYVAFGVFFSVVAWLQAIWAVGVTVLPSKRLLLVGFVGNALVVLVWLISRTTGLPIGPESGVPEPAAFVDVLSTILEVAIVVGTATLLLRGRPTPSVRGLPVWLGLAGLVVVLAILTTWSVAAGATPEGEHGMDHGVDAGAAIAEGSGFAPANLGNGGWNVQVLVDASDAID